MRLFLSLILLLLAACYQPVYGNKTLLGPPSAREAQLNSIGLGNIEGEHGQKLRNLLIDRFYAGGRPAAPRYRLEIHLTSLEQKLGLQKDATTTRARLILTAQYNLLDAATHKSLLTGSSISSVSHNILNEQYATQVSEEDAWQRGLKDLAELVTMRVLLYFDRQKQRLRGLGTEGLSCILAEPFAPESLSRLAPP